MTDIEYDGLVHGLDEATYHRLPGLSSTGAKRILRSPAHFHHYATHPEEPRAEFDLGSAVHSKVLGVGAYTAIYPDGTGDETFEFEEKELDNVLGSNGAASTKAAKAFEADARERGLIPVKRATTLTVDRMVESVLANPTAKKLLETGAPEVSMFATDPATGTLNRGRLDWLGRMILDLKTTGDDASEEAFGKAIFRLGYDVQLAHYEHLYHLITGETLPYLWVVVESSAPFLTNVFRLGDDELLMARRRAREARERYARGLETGKWPGYRNRGDSPIGILRAPVWHVNQYIDDFEGSAA
ncbi:PD-(D/E)XK nuclease-like domain-containing protein [Microbacterium sp. NPDC008134]|uniref:PD-(D/E)XK nuclease-like domain-containing protein n=1 Tax=Microbacterium sp. NPDC008134 TaxID=3364183 RepID=UPI0036E959D3